MTIIKHWTEPNGIFIMNIPVEWQYKNMVINNVEEKSPYSFESYENSRGAFQISCYPLSEKGISKIFTIQKANSVIKWFTTELPDDGDEFKIKLWYAQVDDQFLMIKFVYTKNKKEIKNIKENIEQIDKILKYIRVIPKKDRELAIYLDKYDNFLGSLAASHDLLINAFKSNSYIEIIVILSNQIDAYLRSSIILDYQLRKNIDDFEIEYIFQKDEARGISERKIYKKAFNENIIEKQLFNKLNTLYNKRNKVIHRYIISRLKTKDIIDIAIEYAQIVDETNKICANYEERQFGKNIGIYKNLSKEGKVSYKDQLRIFAMVNDKHLTKKLERRIK